LLTLFIFNLFQLLVHKPSKLERRNSLGFSSNLAKHLNQHHPQRNQEQKIPQLGSLNAKEDVLIMKAAASSKEKLQEFFCKIMKKKSGS